MCIFENATTVKSSLASAAGISSVTVETNRATEEMTGDYYISALPVEVMTPLVDEALKSLALSLANLGMLPTAWMNGIQFYLATDVPLEFPFGR